MKWKATLASVVFLVLAAWTLPAFAEVQNVKVGGDVTVRAFHRENLDLRANDGTFDDEEDFLMSTVGLNIGADLTENVGVFMRLANERDWNAEGAGGGVSQDTDDIGLSQAYITLKELFYSPLTLRLGQQPIVWGRGFVLGSNLLPGVVGNAGDRNGAITADEYTDFTAFDAIRATLDLSNIGGINAPLMADFVYIKLDENAIGSGPNGTAQGDVNLYGINLGTKFDNMNTEAEVYFLRSIDERQAGTTNADARSGKLNTVGIRGSAQPSQGASVWAELAYQFGTRTTDLEASTLLSVDSRQSAWAWNLGSSYTFQDVAMTPTAGAEWRFYSGSSNQNGAVAGWFPLAPGYFTTAIREFQNRSTGTSFYPVDQAGVTSGQTNQHELALFGGLTPLEDLAVNSRLSWFIMDVGAIAPSAGSSDRNSFLGTEWDTQLKYDYTDDVQFGLLYALFMPGSVFRDAPAGSRATAQQVVTTVSVKF